MTRDDTVIPTTPVLSAEAASLAQAMRRPVPLRRPACEVSVVSFNMLLKGFEHKPYYPHVRRELRAWSWRKQQLEALLLGLAADVFCMQEVEVESFADEFAFLADGGYAAVEPRDDSGGKAPAPAMAKCAIFYKSERLQLVWEEHRSRTVLAALRHIGSGRLLYVASCHLEGAPSEAAARVSQTKSALERIRLDQIRRNLDPAECALVFAGDFNGLEDSGACHLLRTGGLSSSFQDPWAPGVQLLKSDYAHEFHLRDLYGGAEGFARLPQRPPTFCAPPDGGKSPSFAAIDFIFYSHRTLRPAAVRVPFTQGQIEATAGVGIPSDWHLSDHVPLGGVFTFLPDAEAKDCQHSELV